MKQKISLSKSLIIITLGMTINFASCHRIAKNSEKQLKPINNNVEQKNITKPFKSKLIASFCAYHILQIQDSAFYKYGMEWRDAQGIAYQNVFTVKNHCDFSITKLKIGETFSCEIVKKPTIENCNVCMGFMEAPSLQQIISVVK